LLWLVLIYRRVRYGYTFRKIPLSRGKFAIVDPEDYDWLRAYKWHAQKGPRTWYAVHSLTNGKKEKRKNLQMHSLLVDIPPGMFCDHINHNGLDNRKANLRPATHTQNASLALEIQGRRLGERYEAMARTHPRQRQKNLPRLLYQRTRRRKSIRQSRNEIPWRVCVTEL